MRGLLLLVCAADGFSVLRPVSRRAPVMRSEADESSFSDYEQPSDTGDYFDVDATVVVDVVATRTALLLKAAASSRGQSASSAALRADVAELAAALESTAAPPTLDMACGRWALAFCETQLFRSSPFWMAGRATCTDGDEARRYEWFCEMHRAATGVSEIGAVRQLISRDLLVSEFETTVAAFPAAPLTVTGTIVSAAEIVGVVEAEGALTFELLQDTVEVKGSNVPGLRTALDAGLKLDSRALADALAGAGALPDVPRPMFLTTYVDDCIRISRDLPDRNLFIYVKESDDPTPTSFEDVSADLGLVKLFSGLFGALSQP